HPGQGVEPGLQEFPRDIEIEPQPEGGEPGDAGGDDVVRERERGAKQVMALRHVGTPPDSRCACNQRVQRVSVQAASAINASVAAAIAPACTPASALRTSNARNAQPAIAAYSIHAVPRCPKPI